MEFNQKLFYILTLLLTFSWLALTKPATTFASCAPGEQNDCGATCIEDPFDGSTYFQQCPSQPAAPPPAQPSCNEDQRWCDNGTRIIRKHDGWFNESTGKCDYNWTDEGPCNPPSPTFPTVPAGGACGGPNNIWEIKPWTCDPDTHKTTRIVFCTGGNAFKEEGDPCSPNDCNIGYIIKEDGKCYYRSNNNQTNTCFDYLSSMSNCSPSTPDNECREGYIRINEQCYYRSNNNQTNTCFDYLSSMSNCSGQPSNPPPSTPAQPANPPPSECLVTWVTSRCTGTCGEAVSIGKDCNNKEVIGSTFQVEENDTNCRSNCPITTPQPPSISQPGEGGPGTTQPIGALDNATCNNFSGWTCDADSYNTSIDVRFYTDGPNGTKKFIGSTKASQQRPDLASGGSPCNKTTNHGFNFTPPNSVLDGKQHTIYAYGINIPSGDSSELYLSPKTINNCASISPLPPAANLKADCSTEGDNLVNPSFVSTTVSQTRGVGGAHPTSLNQKYHLSGEVSGDGFLDVGEWTKDNVWVRAFKPGEEISISALTNWLQVGYNVKSGSVTFSNTRFAEVLPAGKALVIITWNPIPESTAYTIRTNADPWDPWSPADLGTYNGTVHIAPETGTRDFGANTQGNTSTIYKAQVVQGIKYNTSIQGQKQGEQYPYKGQYAGVDFTCSTSSTETPEYTTKYQIAYDSLPTDWSTIAEQDYQENIKVSHTFTNTLGDKFIFVKFKTNKGKENVRQLKIVLVSPASSPTAASTTTPTDPSSPLPPAANLKADCSTEEDNLVNPSFVSATVSQTRGVGGAHPTSLNQKYHLSGEVSGDGFLDVGEWTKDNVWVRAFKPGEEISISALTNWLQVGYNVKSGSVTFSNTRFAEVLPTVKITWDPIPNSTAYIIRTNAFPDGQDNGWSPVDLGKYTGTTHTAPSTGSKDFGANTSGNTSTIYTARIIKGLKYNTSIQGVKEGEAYPYKGQYAGVDFSCNL